MTEIKSLNSICSARSLAESIQNRQVVVIDCRFSLNDSEWGYQQYLHSHIPGAFYLDLNKDLSSPVKLEGGRHPLPDSQILAEKLAAMGIKQNETQIVAYDDSHFAFAARLWWLLRYLGHNLVALLDGGWNAWIEGGYPTTDKTSTPVAPGFFQPQPHLDWVVDRETIENLTNKPNTVLIDSRESDRFSGEREPIDPIAGHIPGAVNAPWKNITDPCGYFLPITEQQKLWNSYSPTQEKIVYCGSGVTACVNLFSLELIGLTNNKLYPGGWSDFISRK
jgi:thiosulfate/3-mercaptopyruvate sulfurtransferase